MNTCDATDVAVIIPAYNEQGAIGKTISAIRQLLPFARIFVCDNNCTDLTASEAEQNGATVIYEAKKGKGNAVRRLLQYVEADIYIMVDGDNTYDLCELPAALEEFSQKHYDLMTGNRMGVKNTYMRLGHGLGNKMFRAVTRKLLGVQTNDVFSGLRIMSKRLVRSFPVISLEFEIETELSVFAARMNLPVKDFPTSVVQRTGTISKLNTFEDGAKILFFVARSLHREFPLRIYLPLASVLLFISSLGFLSVYQEFLQTGEVLRYPTLLVSCFGLATTLMCFFAGMILKEINNLKYESRCHAYAAYSPHTLEP